MTHTNYSEHYPDGYDWDTTPWRMEIDAVKVQLSDGRVIKFPGERRRYDLRTGNLINTGYLTKDDLEDMLNSVEVLENPD